LFLTSVLNWAPSQAAWMIGESVFPSRFITLRTLANSPFDQEEAFIYDAGINNCLLVLARRVLARLCRRNWISNIPNDALAAAQSAGYAIGPPLWINALQKVPNLIPAGALSAFARLTHECAIKVEVVACPVGNHVGVASNNIADSCQ